MKTTEPKYLSENEIEAVFRAIGNNIRDRAIFRLIYHRGLRASEVGLLQLGDYRAAAGRLLVHRLKRSLTNEYLLTEIEISSLRAWLRKRGDTPGPLFPSRKHSAIGRTQIFRLYEHYSQLAGIPQEKQHPHSLKHSCATHLMALLKDITAVQDHLGHADIKSTAIYAKFTRREAIGEQLRDWGKRAK